MSGFDNSRKVVGSTKMAAVMATASRPKQCFRERRRVRLVDIMKVF